MLYSFTTTVAFHTLEIVGNVFSERDEYMSVMFLSQCVKLKIALKNLISRKYIWFLKITRTGGNSSFILRSHSHIYARGQNCLHYHLLFFSALLSIQN